MNRFPLVWMMMIRRSLFLVICFSIFVPQISAQVYTHDFQVWNSIALTKNLPHKFNFSTQCQVRLDHNAQFLRGTYLYADLGYSLNKRLDLGLEYRFSTSTIKDQHRFGISLEYNHKIKKKNVSYRASLQKEFEYFNEVYEKGHEPTTYLRQRLKFSMNLKKKKGIYFSAEPFLFLSNKNTMVSKVRCISGFKYDFSKGNSIDLFYLIQPDLPQKKPAVVNAIGFNYSFDIPKRKKKK